MGKPSERIDGSLRFTMRIDFAVGLDTLTAAAQELLHDEFGDASESSDSEAIQPGESLDDAIDRILAGMTRSVLDATVREGFSRGGYQWLEFGWQVWSESLMAVAGDRPARRVAELFPELVR